jgi:hypothetical protein
MTAASMPGWWYRKRQENRRRKATRKAGAQDVWVALPAKLGPEPAVKPYNPDPNPSTWYQFCTDRQQAYSSRGDHVAAMVWWTMRWLDDPELGSDEDPCTDMGYQDLCSYWNYKLDWMQRNGLL